MKKVIVFALLLLVGCKTESPNTQNLEEVATLQSELAQLKVENELKDSMINESLSFFNEIQNNLEAISVRKESIQQLSKNPEIGGNEKQWILEEIKHINYLREENARKVGMMQDQLKKNGLKIKELEVMLENLMQDIAMRDEQIAFLQQELNRKDQEYSKLFDAYQQKEFDLESTVDDMNTAYYVYGTEKELIGNGVIDKKNGFIGIGKKLRLKDDFNENYFTKLDIRAKKEFVILGEDIKIISTHPSNSYRLEPSGKTNRLTIIDSSEFWKVTKYLIVVVKG
jgi:DNA repair exonuclease SbcCD ATPase subunit